MFMYVCVKLDVCFTFRVTQYMHYKCITIAHGYILNARRGGKGGKRGPTPVYSLPKEHVINLIEQQFDQTSCRLVVRI